METITDILDDLSDLNHIAGVLSGGAFSPADFLGIALGGFPIAIELENAQDESGFFDLLKGSFDDSLFEVITQPVVDATKQGMQDINTYQIGGIMLLESVMNMLPMISNIERNMGNIQDATFAVADLTDCSLELLDFLSAQNDLSNDLLKIIAKNGGDSGVGMAIATFLVSAISIFGLQQIGISAGKAILGSMGIGMGVDFIGGLFKSEEEKAIEEAEKRFENRPYYQYEGRYSGKPVSQSQLQDGDASTTDYIAGADGFGHQSQLWPNILSGSARQDTADILLDPTGYTGGGFDYYDPKVEGAVRTGDNDIQTRQEALLKVGAPYAPANYPAPIINMHGLEIHKEADADEVFRRLNEAILKALNGPMLPSRFKIYAT